ncbi:hypothetical protein VB735_12525 [Halotia wernerae UHCC 0503]|nr:hypothetical protein [Halotia wernerae UHCC 0503]
MTTTAALQIIDGGNKRNRRSSEKATTRPHCKVSIDDVNWVRQQPPCVQQLWLDCIAAEQYGGAAHNLDTNLSRNSFLKASAAINAVGLFEFEEVRSKTQSGRSGVTSYRVKNLHGYFNRHYWENFDNQSLTAESQAVTTENQQVMPQNHQMTSERQHLTFSEAEKHTQQEFQNPNNVSNNLLTTYQQPTKVVGMVVGSSTQNKNTRVEETADAPFGDASPQTLESVEEEKELPAVTDCTSLTLVEATQDESALLLEENQNCGVELTASHEDTFPAAPVAPNFEEQAQPSLFTSLIGENQISGNEDKNHHVDQGSAAPALNDEKWSHEAIAARSKARPGRMQKLKLAEVLRENPGFEFLRECWNDDPALQIVIRKLLAKFPQWGIAIVDAELMEWEE